MTPRTATLIRKLTILLAVRAPDDRASLPEPGDLVVEVTGFGTVDVDSIGILLRREKDDRDGDAWVIEPLERPGEEQRWLNADFLAVPDLARDAVLRVPAEVTAP
jgi:hypothetical protein